MLVKPAGVFIEQLRWKARPTIPIRIAHYPRPNRIKFNLSTAGQEVLLRLNRTGLITSSPERPAAALEAIDTASDDRSNASSNNAVQRPRLWAPKPGEYGSSSTNTRTPLRRIHPANCEAYQDRFDSHWTPQKRLADGARVVRRGADNGVVIPGPSSASSAPPCASQAWKSTPDFYSNKSVPFGQSPPILECTTVRSAVQSTE